MTVPFVVTLFEPRRINIRVGEEVLGYSCAKVPGIQYGTVSLGKTHDSTQDRDVLYFEYEQLPWCVTVTDQRLIDRVRKQDKGYWLHFLLKETLRTATENDRLLYLITRTIQMEKEVAFKEGRKYQAEVIVNALGIDAEIQLPNR